MSKKHYDIHTTEKLGQSDFISCAESCAVVATCIYPHDRTTPCERCFEPAKLPKALRGSPPESDKKGREDCEDCLYPDRLCNECINKAKPDAGELKQEMRRCAYCGCNSNAKMRACCAAGNSEDKLRAHIDRLEAKLDRVWASLRTSQTANNRLEAENKTLEQRLKDAHILIERKADNVDRLEGKLAAAYELNGRPVI